MVKERPHVNLWRNLPNHSQISRVAVAARIYIKASGLPRRYPRPYLTRAMDSMKQKQANPIDPNIVIDDVQLGIWRIRVGKTPRWNLRRHFDSITSAYPLFHRLCGDIFSLSPRIFVFFLVCQIWSGVEDAILMHLSSSLLRMVSQSNRFALCTV
jgi:hypothetical protein